MSFATCSACRAPKQVLTIDTSPRLVYARWAAARTSTPARALAAEALALERGLDAER
ncbi:MAG: hypothetical protein NT167_10985 [Verrucomicrobia bacterium]|nr:hypothetical protein [Verrucomicrobiota bacterium]